MHLRKVFRRIRISKLLCKLKNCEFEMEYIKYLGHRIEHGTVEVDPSKTVATSTWPTPVYFKEL